MFYCFSLPPCRRPHLLRCGRYFPIPLESPVCPGIGDSCILSHLSLHTFPFILASVAMEAGTCWEWLGISGE